MIDSLRNEAGMWRAGDPQPRAADLYHAAAVAYDTVRADLQAALEGERAHNEHEDGRSNKITRLFSHEISTKYGVTFASKGRNT